MASALDLAEPGPDDLALMAHAIGAFAAFDWQALKALPAPPGDRTVTLDLDPPASEALTDLAGFLGVTPEEAAARILDVAAEIGPGQAFKAANTWKRKEGDR